MAVLQEWDALQPAISENKSPAAFLKDYCFSSFVLSASFNIRPVIGKTYYLYVRDCKCFLSLIAPGEWSSERSGEFLAACHLRQDMTWALEMDTLTEDGPPREMLHRYIHAFIDGLSEQPSISASLPHYVRELPYYRRLFMSALASSLQHSLPVEGDAMHTLLHTPSAHLFLPGAHPDNAAAITTLT